MASAVVPNGYSLSLSDERFPTVRLSPPDSPQLTVVAIGGIGADTEEALARLFLEHEATADLFLPTQLYPFNVECLIDSLRSTGRLLVVEEGQGFASVGAEILARVSEMLSPTLRAVSRIAAAEHAIPASRPLERASLPGVDRILAAAVGLAAR
jgi:pyruvate/2-oxoglutarate/acetoin dehydrogenase E1 component